MLEKYALLLQSFGNYRENVNSGFESSDELNARCSTDVGDDTRGSKRNTDLSNRHFKSPHSEQNPTVDALDYHALMVTCSSSGDRYRGVTQDNKSAAACIRQGWCRGKLWRSSWMLECAICRKGILLAWVLAHS